MPVESRNYGGPRFYWGRRRPPPCEPSGQGAELERSIYTGGGFVKRHGGFRAASRVGVFQRPFYQLARAVLQHRNVLVARMEIAAYHVHVSARPLLGVLA